TVGLPVFNGGKYLEQALTSLLEQDYPAFEIIVSDNGSSDSTRAICDAYASRDERLKYHRYEINRGAAWNFNNVVSQADGAYFMWAAHDDVWRRDCLSRYAQALDGDLLAVLVSCRHQAIDSRGQAIATYTNFANDN